MQLIAYEDEVLALLERHGGELLQRLRTDGANGAPLEMQVIRFSSNEAYESYLNDERRVGLQPIRDDANARTEVHRVNVIAH